MTFFYGLVLLVLIVAGAYIGFDLLMASWGRQMREEFEKKFPGKCALCALVDYGILHGHENPDARPKPHPCIEGMARWRGGADK